ncbi:mCG17756 [Mus musculus]|nr:mCG17756 [Mus musculus]
MEEQSLELPGADLSHRAAGSAGDHRGNRLLAALLQFGPEFPRFSEDGYWNIENVLSHTHSPLAEICSEQAYPVHGSGKTRNLLSRSDVPHQTDRRGLVASFSPLSNWITRGTVHAQM